MSGGADGLAEALAAAQARLHSPAESRKEPVSEDEALAILRGLARLCGHDPDAVAGSFLKGGPLADLVRAVMGAQKPPSQGRGAPSRDDTLQTHLRVLELMRAKGVSRYRAIEVCADELDLSPETVKARDARWRKRRVTLSAIYRLLSA